MNRARKKIYTNLVSAGTWLRSKKTFLKLPNLSVIRKMILISCIYEDPNMLANDIGEFFVQKIADFDGRAV